MSRGNSLPKSRSTLLKVVILGDGGVGKSSLMNRFVNNTFDPQSFHTIGVEFLNKELVVDGEPFTLQIWDTAGQERFRSLRTPFYRGADCCMLTYAVDDTESLRNLSMWRQEFLYYADVKDGNNFPFVVIGNKCDVETREVSEADAQSWCNANQKPVFVETSAKDAVNVERAFKMAVRQLLAADAKFERASNVDTVDLKKVKRSQTACCG